MSWARRLECGRIGQFCRLANLGSGIRQKNQPAAADADNRTHHHAHRSSPAANRNPGVDLVSQTPPEPAGFTRLVSRWVSLRLGQLQSFGPLEYDRAAMVIVDWESPFVLRRGRRQPQLGPPRHLHSDLVREEPVVDAWEARFFNILI